MPKVFPLKPMHSNGCGPLCIKMAVDYFGLPYSLRRIDKMARCKERGGMTNKDLIKTIKRLGLCVSDRKNASWQDLKRVNTNGRVVILSWMLKGYIGHFSVLDKTTREYIFLADPETGGIRRMQKLNFMRLWFDYDNIWYPKKSSDIQLRWMAVVSQKKKRRA